MNLVFTMGLLVSTVVLTIFYFLVITPIGIGGAIIWQGLPFRKTRSQREELLAGA